MLANSKLLVNAVRVRLVADEAVQFRVFLILESIDNVGSGNLVLEAHDCSDDIVDSIPVAQDRKLFTFLD